MKNDESILNSSEHDRPPLPGILVLYRMALRHTAPRLLLQLAAWAQSFIARYGFQQGGGGLGSL